MSTGTMISLHLPGEKKFSGPGQTSARSGTRGDARGGKKTGKMPVLLRTNHRGIGLKCGERQPMGEGI